MRLGRLGVLLVALVGGFVPVGPGELVDAETPAVPGLRDSAAAASGG
jgi:hypothetical protein